jgi:hypothetical protein
MKYRIQINPLVGLAGITALAAVVLAATHVPPHAGAERSAAPDSALPQPRTLVTQSVPMGDGQVRAWVRLDPAGQPAALGVTFPESALSNLPAGTTGRSCCDGPEFVLPLPADIPSLPFTHVVVNWNPKGHEPAGVYDKPHFDFHFYTISSETRESITAAGDDLARCTKPLAAGAVPAGYVPAPGGVPRMGAHWILATTPELHGQPFTKTFLYGSYDGRLSFLEPMITLAYLESHPHHTEPLPLPQSYPTPGHYPTAYSINFDPAAREYTVSLDNLRRRD